MNDKKKMRGYQLSLKGQDLAKKAIELKKTTEPKEWGVNDYKWLLEASQIVEPNQDWSEYKGYYANNISEGTWKRFLYGGTVDYIACKTYCQLLNLDMESVIEQNKFDWFEDFSPKEKKIFKRNIINSSDPHKYFLILAQTFIEREIIRVAQLNDISEYRYWKFIEEMAWTMRRFNEQYISYIDVIEIAEKYFSASILEKQFPFKGIKSIKEEIIKSTKVFKFQNSNIPDYIIAKNLTSQIRKEDFEILSSLQTSYQEDMFISRLIDQESHDSHLLEVLTNHYHEKSSKLLAVNSVGILSKSNISNQSSFLQSLIDFVFANGDIREIYSSAVGQRVLGDNLQDNIVISKRTLKKLQSEIEQGCDPIAMIFCLKMLLSQDNYSKLLQIFSSKYDGLLLTILS